ncbi:MAG TPA: hypothetical protein VIF09_29595 [Polyangiaceae bacterium]|jgi:hypothetical protein
MSALVAREEKAQKEFAAQDKRWRGPRFFVLGLVTLAICLTAIYMMSSVTGCSLQIVP